MMLSKTQHSPLFALKRSFVFCNRGPNQNLPRMQDISPMFAVKMKFPIPFEHPCLFLISLTHGFLSQFRFQKCKTSITIPFANSSHTLMLQIYRFTHSITQPNTTHPITGWFPSATLKDWHWRHCVLESNIEVFLKGKPTDKYV